MAEIVTMGTPPVKHMYKATCGGCGTVARFHEDEATDIHCSTMTGKLVKTPAFDCPICDASHLMGIEDGIVDPDYSAQEIGRIFDMPIHSRSRWKRIRAARDSGASFDELWDILEETSNASD